MKQGPSSWIMQNIFTRADKKGFKNGIFPLNYDEEEEEEFKDKEKKRSEIKLVSLIMKSLRN